MNQDDIKALPDLEIEQVHAWCQEEKRARAERGKREAITRIKEMAAAVGITVAIQGQRGRPANAKPVFNQERTNETGKAVKHGR